MTEMTSDEQRVFFRVSVELIRECRKARILPPDATEPCEIGGYLLDYLHQFIDDGVPFTPLAERVWEAFGPDRVVTVH